MVTSTQAAAYNGARMVGILPQTRDFIIEF